MKNSPREIAMMVENSFLQKNRNSSAIAKWSNNYKMVKKYFILWYMYIIEQSSTSIKISS